MKMSASAVLMFLARGVSNMRFPRVQLFIHQGDESLRKYTGSE